ncbi:hypothetical protein VTK56DRAFT_9224 [Thermocarpiscus australiensis]
MSGKVFMVTERMTANEAGPPPFNAQKRSGFSFSSRVTYRPEAVTASKARALSAAAGKHPVLSTVRGCPPE